MGGNGTVTHGSDDRESPVSQDPEEKWREHLKDSRDWARHLDFNTWKQDRWTRGHGTPLGSLP